MAYKPLRLVIIKHMIAASPEGLGSIAIARQLNECKCINQHQQRSRYDKQNLPRIWNKKYGSSKTAPFRYCRLELK